MEAATSTAVVLRRCYMKARRAEPNLGDGDLVLTAIGLATNELGHTISDDAIADLRAWINGRG